MVDTVFQTAKICGKEPKKLVGLKPSKGQNFSKGCPPELNPQFLSLVTFFPCTCHRPRDSQNRDLKATTGPFTSLLGRIVHITQLATLLKLGFSQTIDGL